jgi:subtilase family serine protease
MSTHPGLKNIVQRLREIRLSRKDRGGSAKSGRPPGRYKLDPLEGRILMSAADLQVTSMTLPGASAQYGDALNISWTVTNNGTASTGTGFTDNIYLSNDATFSSDDVLLTSYSHQTALDAGASATQSAYAFPEGFDTGGAKYILIKADAYSSISESDETNNVASKPLTINPVNADLVITAVQSPASGSSAKQGDPVNLSYSEKNQGTAAASHGWYDYVYFSSDQTLDPTDQRLDYVYVPNSVPGGIAAGATATVSKSITIPAYIQAGSGYLIIAADAQGLQGETNDNNNVSAAIPFTVLSTATDDLVVSSASANPTSGSLGD